MANELKEIINCVKCLEYTEEYTDIVLEVDGNKIPVHRQVLALRSEYFGIMFYGKFDESKKNKIEINNVQWSPFKKIIDYIYTGKLSATPKEASEIYSVAHMMRLTDATEKISAFMTKHIYKDNFADYINCSYQFDLPDLKQACINLWLKDFKLPDDQIYSLSEDAVMGLLSIQTQSAGEVLKFNLALNWLKANDESKAQTLMSKINLSNLTKEEIRYRVWPSGYFTETHLLEAVLRC